MAHVDPFTIPFLANLLEAEAAHRAAMVTSPAWIAPEYIDQYQAAGRAVLAGLPAGFFPAPFVAALAPARYAAAKALYDRAVEDAAEDADFAGDVAAFEAG